jgi:two-component system, NarL family, invasion response regulator UvrY
MIRIVIADDHELIREGVKKIIRASRDLKVVGEAADVASTITAVGQLAPDLLVLDVSLPGHDGLEGLNEIRKRFPGLPIIMLSMYPEERFAVDALKAGAKGYITKSMAAEELVKAIRVVVAGGTYISTRLAELLALGATVSPPPRVHERLTPRELSVLTLLAVGRQTKQIAAELGISISSVSTYRNRIFRKMGLSSNAELIRYAVDNKLIA